MRGSCLPNEPRSERGAVMVLTLVVSLAVMMGLAAAVMKATTLARSSQFSLDRLQALSLADGVVEGAQKQMLDAARNFGEPPLQGDVQIGAGFYPYTAFKIGSETTRTDPDGSVSLVQHYEIRASVEVGDAGATVSRLVRLVSKPVFRYGILYDGDLEILPGAAMTIGGGVHSNGTIYTGSGSTLTIDTDHFRAAGGILRERKDDGTETGGTVNIKVLGESTYEPLDPLYDSDNPDWLSYAETVWKGSVKSAVHGVGPVKFPDLSTIQPFDPVTGAKGYYHENADLVIVDDQPYDGTGLLLDSLVGILTSESTFYDAREGQYVKVTDIDIGALNASGKFPGNGLIYAYRTDSSSTSPYGIRLTNGSELAGSLTVVSENPVYVQGDYNTVTPKGAAVIADALNLLSNAWDDSKVAGSLPAATATTYNLAMITGIVPTPDGGGNYSGGFENLPRLHENWSGITATIRGSFVQMFDSRIAVSPWTSGAGSYSPPIRDWQFDPNFLSGSGLPPFTPSSVHFERVLWDDGLPSKLY